MRNADKKDEVHRALLELYLSVKVRSIEEIKNYTQEKLEEELRTLKNIDSLLLIKRIKESVGTILIMKTEEIKMISKEDSEFSTKETIKAYEQQLQSLEAEIRVHVAVMLNINVDTTRVKAVY